MSNKSEVKYEFHYYIPGKGWWEINTHNFTATLLIKMLYGCHLFKITPTKNYIFGGRVHKNLMPLHLKNYIFERLYS